MDQVDLMIVGAGPAGLTAGLYAARAGLSTVVYEKAFPGGLASVTDRIDNYPGFPNGISGLELGEKMHEQAKRFGAVVVSSPLNKVWKEQDKVLAATANDTVSARAAIIATGSIPKKLGIRGEESLIGKGVSYCATCDGPLYREKTVAVIGGGDSALQEALFLTRFADKIVVIHRRSELRAAPVLQKEVLASPKITLSLNRLVKSIEGETQVEGVVVEEKDTAKEELIRANGVFIYVGYTPNVDMLGEEFRKSDDGFLLTDSKLQTSVPGIFAAGDVRAKALRQVATAVGDGAVAAMSAYAYIEDFDKLA